METSTATVLSEVITDESDTDKPGQSALASEDDMEFEAASKKDSTTANTTNRNNGINTTKALVTSLKMTPT